VSWILPEINLPVGQVRDVVKGVLDGAEEKMKQARRAQLVRRQNAKQRSYKREWEKKNREKRNAKRRLLYVKNRGVSERVKELKRIWELTNANAKRRRRDYKKRHIERWRPGGVYYERWLAKRREKRLAGRGIG
jgi:hypothetical protein